MARILPKAEMDDIRGRAVSTDGKPRINAANEPSPGDHAQQGWNTYEQKTYESWVGVRLEGAHITEQAGHGLQRGMENHGSWSLLC